MAFETGSATSLSDFFAKLSTFLTANGWTNDTAADASPASGTQAYHKGSVGSGVWVSFAWDNTGGGTENIEDLAMYQALGYTDGNESGTHPDDSGNGYNGANPHVNNNLDNERQITNFGNGPYPSYHFFENDTNPTYVHIAVEVTTGRWVHFGFGELDKFGDWDTASGGEYAYGYRLSNTTSSITNVHTNSIGLSGYLEWSVGGSIEAKCAATMHMEGWPNQPSGGKWARVSGQYQNIESDDDAGEDTAGVAMVSVGGGFHASPIATQYAYISASTTSGFIPMYPVACFYYDWTTKYAYLAGWQKDVRGINMKNFAGGDTVLIDGDTWYVFPCGIKSVANVAFGSYNMGIAYKKVTT